MIPSVHGVCVQHNCAAPAGLLGRCLVMCRARQMPSNDLVQQLHAAVMLNQLPKRSDAPTFQLQTGYDAPGQQGLSSSLSRLSGIVTTGTFRGTAAACAPSAPRRIVLAGPPRPVLQGA
jgi:hypothetical protein